VKKKKKKFLGKLIVLALICLLVCVFYNKYSGLKEYETEIESLEKQISDEEKKSKELEKAEKEYSSDEYIEEKARELGLVKPDEKIFRNYNDKK